MQDLTGRSVVAVFAHPDDESLACGATLARLADLGASVVLLCATHGERGFVADPALAAGDDVGRIRTEELKAAARVLGLGEVLVLDHPDGNVRWADGARLETEIASVIRRYHADAVITFDDDGLYWHVDHVGVHEHVENAVASLGQAAPALYYVTMARGAMTNVTEYARQKNWVPPPGGFWSIDPEAFGAGAPSFTFTVDAGTCLARKLAALQCHRTQMGPVNPFSLLDPQHAREWLGAEYFRRAPAGGPARILEHLARAPAATV